MVKNILDFSPLACEWCRGVWYPCVEAVPAMCYTIPVNKKRTALGIS